MYYPSCLLADFVVLLQLDCKCLWHNKNGNFRKGFSKLFLDFLGHKREEGKRTFAAVAQ